MYLEDQHSTRLNEGEQEPFVQVYIGASLIFLGIAAIWGAWKANQMPVFYLADQEKRDPDIIYVFVMVCQCL